MPQSALINKSSFRTKSQVFNKWKLLGFTEDPAKVNMDKIDHIALDQIVGFYYKEIKGKPITIIIMGNPKTINLKQIQTNNGKLVHLNNSNLYSVEN